MRNGSGVRPRSISWCRDGCLSATVDAQQGGDRAEQAGQPQKTLAAETVDALAEYSWPGNVRELEHALERAAILTKGGTITRDTLPERILDRAAKPLVNDEPQTNPTLDTIERAYIKWVLESEGGNKSRTAEVLGIDPSTLYRKLSRYGVEE